MTTASKIFDNPPKTVNNHLSSKYRHIFDPKPEKPTKAVTPSESARPKPSTLEAIANVLSLPGSSVVDVLAGANPIDQWRTPTSSENRTSGRELLRKHGLAGKADTWGNAILGFGVELATDPASYLGVGALTKGGQVASKANLLSKTANKGLASRTATTARQLIDQADDSVKARQAWSNAGGKEKLLDEPIQSLVEFKLPGTKGAKLNSPTIAKAIDRTGEIVADLPGMRSLRSAFNPRVLNAVTRSGQELAEQRHSALKDALTDIGQQFAPLIKKPDDNKMASIIRSVEQEATEAGLDIGKLRLPEAKDISSALARSEHLTRASGMSRAALELLDNAAKPDGIGVPLSEALQRLHIDTPQARAALGDLSRTVDESLLADAGRFIRPYTDPETVSTARKAIEGFTRLFKSHVTMPWPAFHTRNLFSGQLQNVLFNAHDPTQVGPMRYVKPLTQAYQLRKGKTLKGLSRDIPEFKNLGLSDKEATQALSEEVFSHGLIGGAQNAAEIKTTTVDAGSRMPGAPLLEKAKYGFNPLDVNSFAPTKVGGNVAETIEGLNRLAPYIAYRKQGYAPEAAAEMVKRIQIDYSDVTEWENKYGRNIVPFYLFASRMLPLTANELATHPGGRTAAAIKASGHNQDNPPPDWMRDQTTIPFGDGHIGGLGLMHEDAARQLGALAQGNVSELSQDIGSRLNPLLKFPLEQATGHSIYHGRPLDSVTPDVGRTLKNLGAGKGKPFVSQEVEHGLRNSPLARYLSTARKLTDRNKKARDLAVQLGTGVYVGE
jgi:hypothetical protein